jgi:membrane associated rhomboid family serine protease/cytochrome c-type biogenesis protein CcmH/NrfG
MANCVKCGRQLPSFSFKKICQWCVQYEAAQRGEEGDDAKQIVMPAPWARGSESSISLTHILFGANVMVFIAMVLASGPSLDFTGQVMVHFGANYGPYTLSGQWWRLVTYMFLHGGLMHIGFNMWCLWDLGALCESLYGRWTFAAIYFITGIGAGVASVGWNPTVLSLGASGAIFGLAGALIASFYLGEFSLPSVAIRGTLTSLLVFVGFNVVFGLFGSMFMGIDNAAHAGGLVVGLILGALIARFAPQQGSARRAGVLALGALMVAGAVLGVAQWRGGPMRAARAFAALSESGGDRIAQLQAIVHQQPNLPQAHFSLAQAYLTQGRLPEAETEFKRVLELQPRDANARFDLGMVYLNEKQPEEATAAFTQMLAQNADDADAHLGMGMALAAEGKHQAAIADYKTAADLGPQASGVYYEMGRSYAQLKMYDEAIAAYLTEKEKDGDDADLEAALAEAYQAKGMTKQAQEALNKAAELRSTH